MSFENPTRLRVGTSGTLSSKRYRVAGRVVMGVVDDGVTYYWQEFNLVNDEGKSATLVFEEGERGGEWKLFVMFEPTTPFTAAEAARKRPGDRVSLDGTALRVTLTDTSRVYHIEGTPPEGIEVGDVAHYFNAESGTLMQVVSWTGEEVECFRGFALQRGIVGAAFGVPETFRSTYPKTISNFTVSGSRDYDNQGKYLAAFAALFVCFILFIMVAPNLGSFRPRQSATVKTPAVAEPFPVATLIKVKGMPFRVTKHLAVEIAEVGFAFKRNEYELTADDDSKSLLVYGTKPGGKDWVWFTPVDFDGMTPQQAGKLRVGDTFTLNGATNFVRHIFQYNVNMEDFAEPMALQLDVGHILFGLSGETEQVVYSARWDNNGIHGYRGEKLSDNQVEVVVKPQSH